MKDLTIARPPIVKNLTKLTEEEIFVIIFLEKEKKGVDKEKRMRYNIGTVKERRI